MPTAPTPANDDTTAMMTLRGLARAALAEGVEASVVVFKMMREARGMGVNDKQLTKVIEDLRGERLLPGPPLEQQ